MTLKAIKLVRNQCEIDQTRQTIMDVYIECNMFVLSST